MAAQVKTRPETRAARPDHEGATLRPSDRRGSSRGAQPISRRRSGSLEAKLQARLQQVEDRVLDRIMANHPNREAALDHLLADVSSGAVRPAPSSRAAMLHDFHNPQRLTLIENLLVAAVLETHPNREKALDRLLDDVVGDMPTLPPEFFDRDWDGLA